MIIYIYFAHFLTHTDFIDDSKCEESSETSALSGKKEETSEKLDCLLSDSIINLSDEALEGNFYS